MSDGLCAAPVHQMQEVYRYGTTDDCMGHWAALYRCLKRKTKFADQVTQLPRRGALGSPLMGLSSHMVGHGLRDYECCVAYHDYKLARGRVIMSPSAHSLHSCVAACTEHIP